MKKFNHLSLIFLCVAAVGEIIQLFIVRLSFNLYLSYFLLLLEFLIGFGPIIGIIIGWKGGGGKSNWMAILLNVAFFLIFSPLALLNFMLGILNN